MQLKLPLLNRLSGFSLPGTKSNSGDSPAQSEVASGQQAAARHRAGETKFKAAQWIAAWEVLQARRKQM